MCLILCYLTVFFLTVTRTRFFIPNFSQSMSSTQRILGTMPVDIEQWRAEIGNFNKSFQSTLLFIF